MKTYDSVVGGLSAAALNCAVPFFEWIFLRKKMRTFGIIGLGLHGVFLFLSLFVFGGIAGIGNFFTLLLGIFSDFSNIQRLLAFILFTYFLPMITQSLSVLLSIYIVLFDTNWGDVGIDSDSECASGLKYFCCGGPFESSWRLVRSLMIKLPFVGNYIDEYGYLDVPYIPTSHVLCSSLLNAVLPGSGTLLLGYLYEQKNVITSGKLQILISFTIILYPLSWIICMVFSILLLRNSFSSYHVNETVMKKRKKLQEIKSEKQRLIEERKIEENREKERKRKELLKMKELEAKKYQKQMEQMNEKDCIEWNYQQMVHWFKIIGMEQYGNELDPCIDGQLIFRLKEEDKLGEVCKKLTPLHLISLKMSLEMLRCYRFPLKPKRSNDSRPPIAAMVWTVSDTVDWLAKLQLGQYAPQLKKHAVTGRLLLDLNGEDLTKSLNIINKYHLKKIQFAIEGLKKEKPLFNSSTPSYSTFEYVHVKSTFPSEWVSQYELLLPHPIFKLTTKHILTWFENLGLARYEEKVKAHSINGILLFDIANDDNVLKKDFGMSNTNHRRSLRLAVENYIKFEKACISRKGTSFQYAWSMGEVCQWMESLGLGTYNKIIRENAVHGGFLQSYSAEDFSKMLNATEIHKVKLNMRIDSIKVGIAKSEDLTISEVNQKIFSVFVQNGDANSKNKEFALSSQQLKHPRSSSSLSSSSSSTTTTTTTTNNNIMSANSTSTIKGKGREILEQLPADDVQRQKMYAKMAQYDHSFTAPEQHYAYNPEADMSGGGSGGFTAPPENSSSSEVKGKTRLDELPTDDVQRQKMYAKMAQYDHSFTAPEQHYAYNPEAEMQESQTAAPPSTFYKAHPMQDGTQDIRNSTSFMSSPPAAPDASNTESDNTCTICYDRKIDCALISCGHRFCVQCANILQSSDKKCPYCKTIITGVLKIF